MTHKQIVRECTIGNLVFLYAYKNMRADFNAAPPANARQVFAKLQAKRFKTDKERVAERNRHSSY